MTAYVIVQIEVTDPERYKDYVGGVLETIEAHGGRFLARGGDLTVLEGTWPMPRLVIIEFPSLEDAKAWHASDAYKPLLDIRQAASNSNLVIVDGA
jgi:uncharacterized protein (DUF1330 family)